MILNCLSDNNNGLPPSFSLIFPSIDIFSTLSFILLSSIAKPSVKYSSQLVRSFLFSSTLGALCNNPLRLNQNILPKKRIFLCHILPKTISKLKELSQPGRFRQKMDGFLPIRNEQFLISKLDEYPDSALQK